MSSIMLWMQFGDDQQCCASNLGSGGEDDVLVGQKKRAGRQYFVITFSQELVLCEASITSHVKAFSQQ
eukprot:scaffold13641_cov42-Cyclotella_meneghiniana.AAC.12